MMLGGFKASASRRSISAWALAMFYGRMLVSVKDLNYGKEVKLVGIKDFLKQFQWFFFLGPSM